ncbi:GNAT family N-acetyltransferase [Geodermatophilus sp. YIM 151500]|uniref:GNAT family N-acetyltransferase n=1 Tax=Geodermatophilus sp. YIM 151500 TaxID=2984531 RepID=UPI0021E5098B|nr:GNAT family N-acetyltransferase [Geodermatophilus sp. YIM 151500]MCV2490113.1 GNAT family N-acetyltransferase [Geodermatophilus sp. YIM 151500]
MDDVAVRPPALTELRDAREVLVEALAADPSWSHVLPDGRGRRAALRTLVGVAIADSGRHARVALAGGRVLGAAVWQPPGRYPMTAWRQARALPRMLPLLVRRPGEARAIRRLGDALDRAFPSTPVRYLQVLGVAPAAQGRRIGARLLREGLAAADAADEVTYLETGKPANVDWYRTHGFDLVAPGAPLADGGPPMWRMRREPAG